MLVRDGGSQKVSFHKLPSISSGPFRTLPVGQNVAMPEAEYAIDFADQVCRPPLLSRLMFQIQTEISHTHFTTACLPAIAVASAGPFDGDLSRRSGWMLSNSAK